MAKKKDLEYEINQFLLEWDYKQISEFFQHIEPLLELYNVTETEDWVADEVGVEDTTNVRLIRTVYLVSRMSEMFASKFCRINLRFKKLWQKMEKSSMVILDGSE